MNRLNFTSEMLQTIKLWKGKRLVSFTENDGDEYVTRIRLEIENKVFDIDNEYVQYRYSDGEIAELTCFSCIESDKNKPLEHSVIKGKYNIHKVEKQITEIYVVNDTVIGKALDKGIPYQLDFETALIIKADNYYAFYRNLIFNEISVFVCNDFDNLLSGIKSIEEIQKEEQQGNPYKITVKRRIEQL